MKRGATRLLGGLASLLCTLLLLPLTVAFILVVVLTAVVLGIGELAHAGACPDAAPLQESGTMRRRMTAAIDLVLAGKLTHQHWWMLLSPAKAPVPPADVEVVSIHPRGYRVVVLSDPTVMPDGAAAAGLDAAELAIETQLVCAGIRRG